MPADSDMYLSADADSNSVRRIRERVLKKVWKKEKEKGKNNGRNCIYILCRAYPSVC